MDGEKLRRDFDLPEEDKEHLDARGLPWEPVSEGKNQGLLIRDFPIPEGYNIRIATAAIQFPTNYPTAGLDMVFFSPALSKIDGVPIRAIEYTLTSVAM